MDGVVCRRSLTLPRENHSMSRSYTEKRIDEEDMFKTIINKTAEYVLSSFPKCTPSTHVSSIGTHHNTLMCHAKCTDSLCSHLINATELPEPLEGRDLADRTREYT